ncbi:copper resistance protein B [Stenotrophomonas riyadhensis]|uniref:copper resistance protein B n=1 Tax=Stenotrophomonas riyadhensis TaxID=2859893 RepID=UPI003F995673
MNMTPLLRSCLLSPLAATVSLAMLGTAIPVSAQTMDHSRMQMPTPVGTPPEATVPPAESRDGAIAPLSASPEDAHPKHAGTPDPALSHESDPTMKHSSMGHITPMPMPETESMQGMDHASMGHGMAPASIVPRTPIPVVTEADRAAAVPPPTDHPVHDNTIQHYVLLNRLETWDADPGTGLSWEAQSWVGTDLNRLWVRSEGERSDGRTESADLELLYGRSISTWWDVVAGVRQDFKPGGSQSFAAIGVQGLAPMKFEVAATAYIGEAGQTAARLEAEYELLLTNRLILQPLVEANFFGKNDPRRGTGAGLSTAEIGLRLRYEFTRKFAPYIGVVYQRAFGNTADLRREELERVDDTQLVFGLRTWF